jgi:hypothetical protein
MVKVVTAEDMYEAVTSRSADMDIIIKAAAVADYRPENVSDEKIKKQDGSMAIPLTRTKDILAYLGEHKKDRQFICRANGVVQQSGMRGTQDYAAYLLRIADRLKSTQATCRAQGETADGKLRFPVITFFWEGDRDI